MRQQSADDRERHHRLIEVFTKVKLAKNPAFFFLLLFFSVVNEEGCLLINPVVKTQGAVVLWLWGDFS